METTTYIRADWCFWDDGNTKLWEEFNRFDTFSAFTDWKKTDEGKKFLDGVRIRVVLITETVQFEEGAMPSDV